jgi:hypothetical protein
MTNLDKFTDKIAWNENVAHELMSFCVFRTLNWSYFNTDDGLPQSGKKPDLLLCYPWRKVGLCIELKFECLKDSKPKEKTPEFALWQVNAAFFIKAYKLRER